MNKKLSLLKINFLKDALNQKKYMNNDNKLIGVWLATSQQQ